MNGNILTIQNNCSVENNFVQIDPNTPVLDFAAFLAGALLGLGGDAA